MNCKKQIANNNTQNLHIIIYENGKQKCYYIA